jgi:hypothetical protein
MSDEIENTISDAENVEGKPQSKSIIIFPFLLSIFFFAAFTQVGSKDSGYDKSKIYSESEQRKFSKINFSALLAAEQFSKNLRDTVYTNDNLWLELRIDQQMLYIHYRNGKVKNLPVSTGNKYLSKGIESRAGLFAIFLKEEVHLSSQFDNARMNYYMPYNMGIGFHGLPGTGYYGNLGIRPSSHGCIRMRNDDARELFKECPIGTLVLAHRGQSTRVVAFAPEGFKNDAQYSKDDCMNILAYNLSSLLEGKYFINPPKRFIIDGTIIPRSGINVKSIDEIPEKQVLPFEVLSFEAPLDKIRYRSVSSDEIGDLSGTELADNFEINTLDSVSSSTNLSVTPDMVKKYVYNPLGVLPYFPPNR